METRSPTRLVLRPWCRRPGPRAGLLATLLPFSAPAAPAQSRAHAPSAAETHFRQGARLLQTHDWKDAAAEFREGVRLDPGAAAGYVGLGTALARLDDRVDAADALHHALEF